MLTNIIYKVIVPLVAAAISGIILYFISPNWEKIAREHGWVSQTEWMLIAKDKGWIKKDECPAAPVHLEIVGPGAGAEIKYTKGTGHISIYTPIVITSSKPLQDFHKIGLITKYGKSKNLYVTFPYFHTKNQKSFTTIDDMYASINSVA